MKNCMKLKVIVFLILIAGNILFAQTQFTIVAVNTSKGVIENTIYGLKVGDEFEVYGTKGSQMVYKGVATIDKLNEQYCRVYLIDAMNGESLEVGDVLRIKTPKNDFQSFLEGDRKKRYEETTLPPTSPKYITLSLFSGYGYSDFSEYQWFGEQLKITQASYIPAGVQLFLNLGPLQIGGEAGYVASPLIFERSDSTTGVVLWQDKIKPLNYGGAMRLNFLKGIFRPFIRGGISWYTGKVEREYSSKPEALALLAQAERVNKTIKSRVGVNYGGGVSIGFLFVDFAYHNMKIKLDKSDSNSESDDQSDKVNFRESYWTTMAGIQFSL